MKMITIPRFFLLSLLVAVASIAAHAQVLEKGDPGTETIEITTNRPLQKKPKRSKSTQLLKISPLMIANGEIPLFWERRVADNWSVELGLGVTTYDFLRMFFTIPDNEKTAPIVTDVTGDGNTVYGLGFTFRSGLRYYPSGKTDFPEGFYFAPELRYKLYNFTYEVFDHTNPAADNVKGRNMMLDGLLVVGYQEEVAEKIFIDYYVGVGIRFRNIQRVTRYEVLDGGSYYFDYGLTDKKNPVPLFSLGLKIGLNL